LASSHFDAIDDAETQIVQELIPVLVSTLRNCGDDTGGIVQELVYLQQIVEMHKKTFVATLLDRYMRLSLRCAAILINVAIPFFVSK